MEGETFIERFMGYVDVERLNGDIDKDCKLYRHEKYADENDIESVYEMEYVVDIERPDGVLELFVGDDKGNNITIKERKWK